MACHWKSCVFCRGVRTHQEGLCRAGRRPQTPKYAIEGMLSGLDPHSAYLDEEDYRDIRVGTSGEFGGLGIEVGMENGFVKVIARSTTPRHSARVCVRGPDHPPDDQPVKGMTLDEAVRQMRGKAGHQAAVDDRTRRPGQTDRRSP